ncbi:SDR family oxidoreductase [Actinomadura napierensis]|uniref:HTH tetR-type domain-containing protein n=1 Tax=Actinomadura napierensis TaxID=267854 RepID=A0ABN3A4U0_9ACTN
MAVTRRGSETEAAFMNAARKVIAEKGFFNAKIADIAAEAGRSSAAFYNYWDSKESMLEGLADRFAGEVLGRTEQAHRHGAPHRNILEAVRTYWNLYKEHMGELVGVFQLSMVDDRFAERWAAVRRYGIEGMMRGIRQAQRHGAARDLDPWLTASALSGMIEYFCYIWLARQGDPIEGEFDEERAVVALAEVWYRTLYGAAEPEPDAGAAPLSVTSGRPASAAHQAADLFSLDGKVAVVTGASSGLGARFARVLADAGATVVLAARRMERLEELAAGDDRLVPVRCDVGDDASLRALVETTLERCGSLDVLVNNAGTSVEAPAEDEDIADFRRVIDTNLTSVFALTQLVARPMLEAGSGSIVNIASIFGLVASSPVKQASYTASKAAVVNLTRELGVQWASRGVRVNALAPAFFPSEMTGEMFTNEGSMRWLQRNTPMRRPGEPQELDGALLLLASQAGSYITGQTIPVDGGWTAR